MNIHPIIVHFPIVFLSVYCILECVMTFAYKNHPHLLWLKKWSLWIGTVTVFFALSSGELAQDIVGKSPLVHLHEEFAEIARNVFIVLSLIYLCAQAEYPLVQKYITPHLSTQIQKISSYAHTWKITLVLSLLGFLLLISVGALGGAILRGTDHEPIAHWLVQTFGIES